MLEEQKISKTKIVPTEFNLQHLEDLKKCYPNDDEIQLTGTIWAERQQDGTWCFYTNIC